jgi:hypothetical protein
LIFCSRALWLDGNDPGWGSRQSLTIQLSPWIAWSHWLESSSCPVIQAFPKLESSCLRPKIREFSICLSDGWCDSLHAAW